MIHLQGEGFTEIYPQLLSAIRDEGDVVYTRGKQVTEVSNMGFTINNPLQCTSMQKDRKFNFAYAVIEMLSLFIGGREAVEPLIWYNPNMKSFQNQRTKLFDGSYADRLSRFQQLSHVYSVLKQDTYSRRAVLDFYNAYLDQHDSADICCTLNIVYQIRNGLLNSTCFMRGNDAVWGIYDYTMFCWLQNVLSTWLYLDLGTYTHIAASFHIYQDKMFEANEIIEQKNGVRENHPLEFLPRWDITSPTDTFEQIKQFFIMEKAYRDGETNFSTQVLNNLTSDCLKTLWLTVVQPHADAKLAKLA